MAAEGWWARDPGVGVRWLLALLAAAVAIRLAVAFLLPNFHHADEIYQVLEPAHRTVFGYGIVPWEFQDAARSWLLPWLLSAPLWIAGRVSDDPTVLTLGVRAAVALLSLGLVAAAFAVGRRISPLHGVAAGVATAAWYELVLHAPRTLSETIATVPLVGALALTGTRAPTPARLATVGLLLGVAAATRFHLGPAVAVIALWVAWRHGPRALVPLALGGIVPLATLGLVDTLTWGSPFASVINNVRINVLEGRAATFGELPAGAYIGMLITQWRWATPALLLLALLGARRLPLWVAVAVVIVATHSVIGHKELRFVFPAQAIVIVLAGIGTGDVLAWARRRLTRPASWRLVAGGVLLAWVATSALLAIDRTQGWRWTAGRASIDAFAWLYRQPDLCGLAVDEIGLHGGYGYLHRQVPILLLSEGPWADRSSHLVTRAGTPPPGDAYALARCFGEGESGLCVYVRPGGCGGAAA